MKWSVLLSRLCRGRTEDGSPYLSQMTGEHFYKGRPTVEKPPHASGVRVMTVYLHSYIPVQPAVEEDSYSSQQQPTSCDAD